MKKRWDFSRVAAEQLFEMAAIIEQGGFDFYARLIARTSNPSVMSELKLLRDEEAAHKAFFLDQVRAGELPPEASSVPGWRSSWTASFSIRWTVYTARARLAAMTRPLLSVSSWSGKPSISTGPS